MLIIKCAYCRSKLFKYKKIGPGEVLRCHKSRITQLYKSSTDGDRLRCESCGKSIGINKGSFYKMIKKSFTYKGEKLSSR
jgi:NAD-dependent SIR2 family protein deacetylase|nr:hypothetical protein [Maridesulfovibrio bastinii]